MADDIADRAASQDATIQVDDEGGKIPAAYADYLSVFSAMQASELPPNRPTDHMIDVEPGSRLPVGRIYNLSEVELASLKAYIETNLAQGFITRSTSPTAAPIIFVKKKDGSLRLCVDYRALNAITVKNRYPLPLISEMLDRMRKARKFTKLDLRNAYHLIRIREGDEYKTAFRTRYGQFEYRVMPFGLTNAPATFQAYIDAALGPLLDDSVVCYLDDILIFSEDPEQHEAHVIAVLDRLRDNRLFCKASKCEFSVDRVRFLGFEVSSEGVSMEVEKIDSIEQWRTPRSVKDVQIFLGFANFYRRFIAKYAKITAPISNLLRQSAGKFEWSRAADAAFAQLKRAFTTAPILQHFDPEKPIVLQTDASGFAIAGIINQHDAHGQLRPCAYFSRKCLPAEQNYDTYDRELLAIVDSMRHWRHYLEGARHRVLVKCDHKNLTYFQSTKTLSRRQARWAERLSAFDFDIDYLEGDKNPADGPSRRPDYADDYDASRPHARLLATLRSAQPIEASSAQPIEASSAQPIEASTEDSTDAVDSDLMSEITTQTATDPLAQEIMERLRRVKTDADDDTDATWSISSAGALLYEGRIYAPEASRNHVIRIHHDAPESGHFGIARTAELVSRNFYWPGLEPMVRRYVLGCDVCARIKAPRHRHHGRNMPIPPATRPWEGVTMDFVTDLPPSSAESDAQSEAYTCILVIVDRFTKMAIYLPCRKDIDSPELARLFFEHVICQHGVPEHIITDRGTQFTARFWSRVCSHMSINHRLSTAFHPQTDGQTERQNQVMEQYLRAYVDYLQANWLELLPLAQFAYNNSKHGATTMTPFRANYGFDPRMHVALPKELELDEARFPTQRTADAFANRIAEVHAQLRTALDSATRRQTNPATDGKHVEFAIGEKVWLSTKNITTSRPSKKLDAKRIGPYEVIKQINANAYRLRLPHTMKIHNVFHVSLLDKYRPPTAGQNPPEPDPVIADDAAAEPEWEVERIVDSRIRYRKLQYLVQWAGYDYLRTSWEPADYVDNSPRHIAEFHRAYPEKPSAPPSRSRR